MCHEATSRCGAMALHIKDVGDKYHHFSSRRLVVLRDGGSHKFRLVVGLSYTR